MTDTGVYIYDAIRTPRGKGKADGALAQIPPQVLVTSLLDELQSRYTDLEQALGSLALGCVGQIEAQGGQLALQCRIAAGLPDHVCTQTVNNYCISSLTALANSTRLALNSEKLHVVGGVESMSQVGFLADRAHYYTNAQVSRNLQWVPPILGAELMATREGIGKLELDQVSLNSHQRAADAWQQGRFADLVVPVRDQDGEVVLGFDELVRADLSNGQLAKLAPAFEAQGKQGFEALILQKYRELNHLNYTHSIANCPGMADGASILLIGSGSAGAEFGLKPKAKILAISETAGCPLLQFDVGFDAMEQVFAQQKLTLADIDRIELMEAFAAVPAKFYRDFQPDPDKTNVNGGHLAMGHPMGATGTILAGQLVHELSRSESELGLTVGFGGGGQGVAMLMQNSG